MPNDKNMNDLDMIVEYKGDTKEDIIIEIVKNMIKNNRPIQHIAEDTGLPKEEIMKIKGIMRLIKDLFDRHPIPCPDECLQNSP